MVIVPSKGHKVRSNGGSPSILRICLNLMVINCENAEKRKKSIEKGKKVRSFSLSLFLPVGAYLRSYSPISCFGVYTSIVFEAHQTLFLSDRTFLTRILFFSPVTSLLVSLFPLSTLITESSN